MRRKYFFKSVIGISAILPALKVFFDEKKKAEIDRSRYTSFVGIAVSETEVEFRGFGTVGRVSKIERSEIGDWYYIHPDGELRKNRKFCFES